MPGLGIAASSEVRSVLLVSDVSREKIGSVALDPASRTSAALTRILLKRVYGVNPEYREGRRKPADARLIIGDPALKTRLNGHVVLDLAAEWRAFSGTPVRLRLLGGPRKRGHGRGDGALLRRSYAIGIHQFDRLVREESAASGLSEPVVEDYLRHALHFELDAGDLEGLSVFYRLAAEDGLIPEARPLRFV